MIIIVNRYALQERTFYMRLDDPNNDTAASINDSMIANKIALESAPVSTSHLNIDFSLSCIIMIFFFISFIEFAAPIPTKTSLCRNLSIVCFALLLCPQLICHINSKIV